MPNGATPNQGGVSPGHQAADDLSALIDSTEDFVWSVDLNFRLVTFNQAVLRSYDTEFDVQAAPGMRPEEILPPGRAARWISLYERTLKEGSCRLESMRADGRSGELTLRPVVADGKIVGISIFGTDITERKAAEEARALLASVVESSNDAIHTVTLDGTVASWNRGAESLFGYKADEVVGRSIAILAPPGRGEEVPQHIGFVSQGGVVRPFETTLRAKDGQEIDVSLSISPIRNSEGKVVGASAIAQDIRERKRVERELKEAEKKYRDIFDGAIEGMFMNRADGKPMVVNRALSAMLGYESPEEFLATVKDLSLAVWKDAKERQRLLQLIGERGSVHGLECQFKRKDGSIFWVSVTCHKVQGNNPEATYIEGFVEDINERKHAELALRLSAESLKESQAIGGLGSYELDIVNSTWRSSEVMDEIFGIDADHERTVAGWVALLHPDEREAMSAYFSEEVLGRHQPFDREYRIIRQNDQKERWVHGVGKLEFDSNGRPLKMRGVIKDITDHKRADMELRESEERYRATFEQIGLGITHSSFDGRIMRCNARFAEFLGYALEEVAGLSIEHMTAPEDRAACADIEGPVHFGTAQSASIEKRFIRKDGSLTWGKVTLSIRRDKDGRAQHFIALVEDINALKAAEGRLTKVQDELRLSEERYRTAFQTSLDAVNINRVDDGSYVECNKAFFDIIGYTRQELVGHSSVELGIWVDPGDRNKMVDAIRLEGSCRDLEARFRRKNGEVFWGRMSASPIDIDGVPCVLTISRDISDAKAAELMLAEATKALRTSEERYRKVFQTSLDAITLTRIDNRQYIDVNQAFLDVMGFERDEVIGKTPEELNIWTDPRDKENLTESINRTQEFRNVEVQFRKKNGETCWGLMSVSTIQIEGVRCALAIARDVSHAKEAEDAIRNLAFYDTLTSLPNRRLLLERLQQALSASTKAGRMRALLFVDLDNFKTLNDTLGHQTGDLLLQEASRRLSACVRETDTVGRLGGDEFVLMLEDLSEVQEEAAAQAKAVSEKVLFTIAQPYMLDGRVCRSSASIGISLFGDRRENSSEVLQQADIAMYQAKAAGRNTMRFFAPALQAAVNTRATLEEELRQAIRSSQFVLYYQPQIDRNRLIGAEALIRWNHPVRNILPPGEFISLAEETGLILPIGKWVLDTACMQIAAWTASRQTAHLSISVNISARQFRQVDFVAQVLTALDRSGANPRNLKLELTESMLVENVEDVIEKMTELKSHGLRFSLDDFGTGYSSLAYLKRLPLDQLKIDRSFVRDILVDESSAAIAQTIVSLSRAMGLPVIAEGVETEAQREFLTRIGCHSFQGFLFSQPLPLIEFENYWLNTTRNVVTAGD